MSRDLRRLAILFSVTLNVAFLGTYAYHEAPRWIGNGDRRPLLPYEMIHLTAVQRQAFDQARHSFHARLQQVGTEIKTEQLRLVDLLAEPQHEVAALRATQERIQGLQRVMQDAVINHLLEQKAVLAAEQRTHFFRLIRERIERGDQGTPPWMTPAETGQSATHAR